MFCCFSDYTRCSCIPRCSSKNKNNRRHVCLSSSWQWSPFHALSKFPLYANFLPNPEHRKGTNNNILNQNNVSENQFSVTSDCWLRQPSCLLLDVQVIRHAELQSWTWSDDRSSAKPCQLKNIPMNYMIAENMTQILSIFPFHEAFFEKQQTFFFAHMFFIVVRVKTGRKRIYRKNISRIWFFWVVFRFLRKTRARVIFTC